MHTLEIKLPERVHAIVEAQASAGGFPNAEDYVQSLIRAACEGELRSAMDARIQEGIDAFEGGDAQEMTEADWARIKAAVIERHSKRNRV